MLTAHKFWRPFVHLFFSSLLGETMLLCHQQFQLTWWVSFSFGRPLAKAVTAV